MSKKVYRVEKKIMIINERNTNVKKKKIVLNVVCSATLWNTGKFENEPSEAPAWCLIFNQNKGVLLETFRTFLQRK